MGGLYDILESYRDRQNRLNYEGLYQDPDRFLDFDNSRVDFTNQADYPFTGNIPTNRRARYDARAYNRNEPLPSPYGIQGGTFFKNFNPRVGFPNTSVFGITPENFSTTGIMQQAPTLSDLGGITPSYGVANEQDVEQLDSLTGEKKSGGILDLIMSIVIPGYGFLKDIGKGGFEGIRGLNQRLQQSDFGRSRTLADYFDARSYGGRDARDRAAQQNMREARAIQKKIDRGEYGTASAQDKARGQMPSRTTSAPKRSFSSDYSAAQRARKF